MKHGGALEPTLDAADWDNFRALAREMMATVDDLKGLPTRHAWRPLSGEGQITICNTAAAGRAGASGGVPGFLEICEALSFRTVHTALLGLGGWHRDE
jgi:hypothetical protein